MFPAKINLLLDVLLPRHCLSCKIKLRFNDEFLCNSCLSKLEPADPEFLESEFIRKFLADKIVSDFVSAYHFTDDSVLQDVIHSLKYEQNFRVGKFLGINSAKILKDRISTWHADLIIPVPLHALRKAERGFNQSYEIAKGLSKTLNIKVDNNILERKKFTNTQTTLSLAERKKNIENAFVVRNGNKVLGKSVILVDDVITTGATITECAQLLLSCCAEKIYALSVGIAK